MTAGSWERGGETVGGLEVATAAFTMTTATPDLACVIMVVHGRVWLGFGRAALFGEW